MASERELSIKELDWITTEANRRLRKVYADYFPERTAPTLSRGTVSAVLAAANDLPYDPTKR